MSEIICGMPNPAQGRLLCNFPPLHTGQHSWEAAAVAPPSAPPEPEAVETPHGITIGHPEAICDACGGPNIVWHAPNELWNRAMPNDGIVCPLCFVVAARKSGIDLVWCLAPAVYDGAGE